MGVAKQLMSYFRLQGLDDEAARRQIWFVDSQGLIYEKRGPMAEHKKCEYKQIFSLPFMDADVRGVRLCETGL